MLKLQYGTKFILETLRSNGYQQLSTILMCGGLSKNKLYPQTHADVIGLPVLLPKSPEPVLLGSAILGMVGAGKWKNVREALGKIVGPAHVFTPSRRDEE